VTSSHSVTSHAQSQKIGSKHKYFEDMHHEASTTRIKAPTNEGIEVMKGNKTTGK
jgi:hypothetical protein